MRDEIELILKPGTTRDECGAVARALTEWCNLTQRAPLSCRVRVTIKGGPYWSRDEVVAFLRALIPSSAVDDVLVGGQSWTADANNINPERSSAEADMPDAAAD